MDDPTAPGMRLLRTLDWPFHGLGRNLVVARQTGPAGEFLQPDMARFRRGRAGHGAGPVRGCVKSGATGASLEATRLRRLAV